MIDAATPDEEMKLAPLEANVHAAVYVEAPITNDDPAPAPAVYILIGDVNAAFPPVNLSMKNEAPVPPDTVSFL